jgi:hypothetical protein
MVELGLGLSAILGSEIDFSVKAVEGVFWQGSDCLLAMGELVIKGKVTYIPYAMILQHSIFTMRNANALPRD